MVNRPITSLLPFACIKMHKVVSVRIQRYWHCHSDPFSCLGQCNSRSIPLSCRHHGKAAQTGTRDLIHWPHFLYPENESTQEMVSEVSSSLEMVSFWLDSSLGCSGQRRRRWRATCPLSSCFIFSVGKADTWNVNNLCLLTLYKQSLSLFLFNLSSFKYLLCSLIHSQLWVSINFEKAWANLSCKWLGRRAWEKKKSSCLPVHHHGTASVLDSDKANEKGKEF